MRYLKTLTLNRRRIYDERVAVTTGDVLLMNTLNSVILPNSNSAIASPALGQMRYNTTTNQVEVYQGTSLGSAVWRALRYKESTQITTQTLGYGDADTIYFGPLNPAPPSVVESGTTWSGANLIVMVENVIQLHVTNYTIEQNPSIAGRTYTPKTSGITNIGATTINFDPAAAAGFVVYPSVDITGAVVSGDAAIQSGTVITSYTTNSSGILTSIDIDLPTVTSTIPNLTTLTITDSTNTGSGYFVKFSSAVPLGKPVVVLHGFDK
jgi:hypothetical protein